MPQVRNPQSQQTQLNLDAEPRSYTVSELNGEVKWLLDSTFGSIWVEGELSSISRPASGHIYFALKDERAQIRCAMFRADNRRLKFKPQDGAAVICRGRLGIYEARGDYQLIVDRIIETGAGALQRQFEANKRNLYEQGLFDSQHKQTLPLLPTSIGIISSTSGAALQDVLNVLGRRYPIARVVIYPVSVQGVHATPAICKMLQCANRRRECDLLLLVRGGGSIEDLWAFNEEAVARAIYASTIPVVSGVGHEVDSTIADYVADVRAPTPSAAAELATPEAGQLLAALSAKRARVLQTSSGIIRRYSASVEKLQQRLERRHPARRLQQLSQRCDELEIRLRRAVTAHLERTRTRSQHLRQSLQQLSPARQLQRQHNQTRAASAGLVAAMHANLGAARLRYTGSQRTLAAVSPLNTLSRGYAIVETDDSRVLTDSGQTSRGDRLNIRLQRGRLAATVLGASNPATDPLPALGSIPSDKD